jgi:hypothetical protein
VSEDANPTAEQRAEWLHNHGAAPDWVLLTLAEVAELKAALVVRDVLAAENKRKDDLLEAAWGIIANASQGAWIRETEEWRQAAIRWRDTYLGQTDES